jgi:nucleotide-binding universal stress UspA family protein
MRTVTVGLDGSLESLAAAERAAREARSRGLREALFKAADDAEVIVLGTRGLSGVGGFMVGSAGLAVVPHG